MESKYLVHMTQMLSLCCAFCCRKTWRLAHEFLSYHNLCHLQTLRKFYSRHMFALVSAVLGTS